MPGGKHVLGQGKNRIFGTAKVGDRGQIVIPQEARRFYGRHPADPWQRGQRTGSDPAGDPERSG